ncbi:MAG: peptidase S8 [Chloroflexi bacterium]|nr:MAG: peptidase S8 [Chloroflexota bacterium]
MNVKDKPSWTVLLLGGGLFLLLMIWTGSRTSALSPVLPHQEILSTDSGHPGSSLSSRPSIAATAPFTLYLPAIFRPPEPVTPNDTYYSAYQWNLRQIEAPLGWALSTGSNGVVIAVLDTGVDLTHPDLQGKLVAGYDFINNDSNPSDDQGHGTHVAGIAAALSNNSRGIAGVSWGARIMPVKVLGADGTGPTSGIANGIIWATDHGADVINLSLGGSSSSATLQDAVNYAYNQGVLVVAAAGNWYQQGNPVIYPAAYPHVVAVAATGDQNEHAYYSETGYYVDVAAPGGNPTGSNDNNANHWILSTYWRGAGYGDYLWVVGTSQATPHVAGLAALVWSVKPSLTNDQVEQLIENTAVDLGTPGRDDVFGYGRIDVYAALSRAQTTSALPVRRMTAPPGSQPAPAAAVSATRLPLRTPSLSETAFVPGALLVKFRAGVSAASATALLSRYPVQVTGEIAGLGVLRLSVPEGQEQELSRLLAQEPSIEYAEPDYYLYALSVPSR